MKILAADDDKYILELLTMMTAKAGFADFSTASSGEMALDMLNAGDVVFDCLLLDISMPGMDGIELCSRARAIPAYSKTPIIMLTAMAEKDYIDRAFRAGATDYANKPFDLIELHARLRMAEELVAARQEVGSSRTKDNGSQSEDAREHFFDLSDEIKIEGVTDLIGYAALKNYLAQLSHSGIAASQVVAIKINSIEKICEQASEEEFLYALTETADAISKTFNTDSYMMAYSGNGTFVVVSGKATLEQSAGLETKIQSLIDERDTEYNNGDPLDLEITIGNPLRPSTSKTQRIRKTFDRAIARVENRVMKKKNELSSAN
jgi:CheY-like chemotaxis protein